MLVFGTQASQMKRKGGGKAFSRILGNQVYTNFLKLYYDMKDRQRQKAEE